VGLIIAIKEQIKIAKKEADSAFLLGKTSFFFYIQFSFFRLSSRWKQNDYPAAMLTARFI
jgi:hypothetical protein